MKTTKGMSIAQVYNLCDDMWQWIKLQLQEVQPNVFVADLKEEWCDEHGYRLHASCFFCDYAKRTRWGWGCDVCPGRLIQPDFSCYNSPIWYDQPIEFADLIHEMNIERKKRKIR